MITPVVIGSMKIRWFAPPELGETIRWGLFWNPGCATRWVALTPPWAVTATVRSSSKPRTTRLGRDSSVDIAVQPSIGHLGSLQFMFDADMPVPSRIDVSGALILNAGTSRKGPILGQVWADFDDDAVTVGVVRRLRLMSVESDVRPDASLPHGTTWGWATRQFLPGTERFYELRRAPKALASYPLTDRANGAWRESFLVVDVETDQSRSRKSVR
ncbi:hypothetical protein ABH922_001938 [Rhodococcus sp. 27YEA15]|uniref:hypothetical protein n=1 Tax=Rhodococcus sp. 27YEA15 TaxID=3156259 RepID=UPI003C7DC6C5